MKTTMKSILLCAVAIGFGAGLMGMYEEEPDCTIEDQKNNHFLICKFDRRNYPFISIEKLGKALRNFKTLTRGVDPSDVKGLNLGMQNQISLYPDENGLLELPKEIENFINLKTLNIHCYYDVKILKFQDELSGILKKTSSFWITGRPGLNISVPSSVKGKVDLTSSPPLTIVTYREDPNQVDKIREAVNSLSEQVGRLKGLNDRYISELKELCRLNRENETEQIRENLKRLERDINSL